MNQYKRGLIQAFDDHQECANKIVNKATKGIPGDSDHLGALITANLALLGRTVSLGFLAIVEAIEDVGERVRLK